MRRKICLVLAAVLTAAAFSSCAFVKAEVESAKDDAVQAIQWIKRAAYTLFSPYKGVYRFDGEERDQAVEQVIAAIQTNDIQYIQTLFSKKALREAENFEDSFERLVGFFQGELISCEFQAETTSDSKSGGVVRTENRFWYSVVTDKEEYLLFVLEYPRDQADRDNEGVYMLQLIRMESRESLFDGGQNIRYAGIYVPEA